MSSRDAAIREYYVKKRLSELIGGTSVPSHTHSISDVTSLQTDLDSKQATLVSGTNIKTINSSSILGSGDLVISGGATNLSYNASTRVLASDTGTDATLPVVVASGDSGLMTGSDKAKLDAISGTNTGDQTSIVGITGTKAQFDTAVTDGNFLYVGDVTSNATHTGDVTGATSLTIDPTAITGKTTVTAVGTDYLLISDTSDSGNLKKALASDLMGSGGSTVYYGHLQSDYTLTSTTAVQKLFNWSTNGALTLPTGIYRFRCMIYLTTMSGTSGNGSFRLKGGGTATLARILYHVTGIDNTSPLNAGTRTGSASVTENSVASMVTATTGTGLTAIVEGFFDVTVTGTIIPSIALVTAAAAVVKAGSFFECEKVADTATAVSTGWT